MSLVSKPKCKACGCHASREKIRDSHGNVVRRVVCHKQNCGKIGKY